MEFAQTFKDSQGRAWTVELTRSNARRLKDIIGVSLEDLVPMIDGKSKRGAEEMQPLQALFSDPFRVFDLFYTLVKPTADTLGLTKEQLDDCICRYKDADGKEVDATELMALAVIGALQDFFRRDPTRRAVLGRVQEVMKLMGTRIDKELAKLDLEKMIDALPGIDAATLNEIALAHGMKSAADSLATSAASIQTP